MSKQRTPFKKPSKKHTPPGLAIMYEDKDIIVVNKVHGLLTVATENEREHTAYFLLTDFVKKGNSKSKNRVYIVHRLDRDTSGVIVFAKTTQAKNSLQKNWPSFSKVYYAVVDGTLKDQKGTITSYLAENSNFKVYSTKNEEEGKLAKTGYEVVNASSQYSLLKINLFTGRKNQIRVHLAEHGNPVVGDRMYGTKEKGIKRLALHAASLTFKHPFTDEEMTFETNIPPYFKELVKM